MKINAITLDGGELPETVTVTMTLAEVAVIADWTGGLSGVTSPAPAVTSGIYDALVGGVVNRFWDDGMNDLRKITTRTEGDAA